MIGALEIGFGIASQRIRPETAGPKTSSAKQSSTAPLDCFVAYTPRNDEGYRSSGSRMKDRC